MSGAAGVAAVTACLRNLLSAGFQADPDLADTVVTAQPLDKARDAAASSNQLNLFLYLITPNAAWRNQPMPDRVRPNEVATPPVALNLFYILSAYGRDDDSQMAFSHYLLGQAMRTFQAHPVLSAQELQSALPTADLSDQIERIRITLQPLSLEDISKLWAGFQMQFRLSVAYEVSVVLIDSGLPVRAALPVLRRGTDDRGPTVMGSTPSLFPQATAITPSTPVEPGAQVTVSGVNLGGAQVAARLTWSRATASNTIAATVAADGGSVTVVLPKTGLNAGPAMLALEVTPAGAAMGLSNELPLLVAPLVTSKWPIKCKLASGAAIITLKCSPAVLLEQRAALLLGDREIPADARIAASTSLSFTATGLTAGSYPARLRVDGVDSTIIDPTAKPPAFDASKVVEVTA